MHRLTKKLLDFFAADSHGKVDKEYTKNVRHIDGDSVEYDASGRVNYVRPTNAPDNRNVIEAAFDALTGTPPPGATKVGHTWEGKVKSIGGEKVEYTWDGKVKSIGGRKAEYITCGLAHVDQGIGESTVQREFCAQGCISRHTLGGDNPASQPVKVV